MAGAFPGAPNNLDLHTTDGGTVYQFLADHDRWVLYKAAITDPLTLTADLTITKAAGDTFLVIENTSDDAELHIKGVDQAFIKLYSEDPQELRWGIYCDKDHGNNIQYAQNSSNTFVWQIPAGTEKMRLDADELLPGATDTMSLGSAAKNWDEIFVNTVTEGSSPLPDDPPNWKELLPEFVRKTIKDVPIYEQYTELNEEGGSEGKERIIGTEDKIFINVGMVARLALREVELLKKEIEALKKKVSG